MNSTQLINAACASSMRSFRRPELARLLPLAVVFLSRCSLAYIDCSGWYGKWANSPKSPPEQLHDQYWITVGPTPSDVLVNITAEDRAALLKAAWRSWTHCGPGYPDVVSR